VIAEDVDVDISHHRLGDDETRRRSDDRECGGVSDSADAALR